MSKTQRDCLASTIYKMEDRTDEELYKVLASMSDKELEELLTDILRK